MKKIVLTLIFASMGLLTFGQPIYRTVSGNVVDNTGAAVEGVAVFFASYEYTQNAPIATKDSIRFMNYTDSSGNYTLNFPIWDPRDTVSILIIDCNGGEQAIRVPVDNTPATQQSVVNFSLPCVPNFCDVVFSAVHYRGGDSFYRAAPLRDQRLSSNPLVHTWTYGSTTYSDPNSPTNWSNGFLDVLQITATPQPQVCYELSPACSTKCESNAGWPSCQASFYLDTLNPLNTQGHLVIRENSTYAPGLSAIYYWDFGDGSRSYLQHPMHTYSDSGAYLLCLTIEVTDSLNRTCTSTFCDSVGFDANGNLIFKTNANGFTINVVDGAALSLEEQDVFESLTLFPNPSPGRAELQWDERMQVRTVELLSTNGQRLQRLNPTGNHLNFDGLSPGLYLVRVQSEYGEKSLKLIVR